MLRASAVMARGLVAGAAGRRCCRVTVRAAGAGLPMLSSPRRRLSRTPTRAAATGPTPPPPEQASDEGDGNGVSVLQRGISVRVCVCVSPPPPPPTPCASRVHPAARPPRWLPVHTVTVALHALLQPVVPAQTKAEVGRRLWRAGQARAAAAESGSAPGGAFGVRPAGQARAAAERALEARHLQGIAPAPAPLTPALQQLLASDENLMKKHMKKRRAERAAAMAKAAASSSKPPGKDGAPTAINRQRDWAAMNPETQALWRKLGWDERNWNPNNPATSVGTTTVRLAAAWITPPPSPGRSRAVHQRALPPPRRDPLPPPPPPPPPGVSLLACQ